jgi:hypothetical protein
LYIPVIFDVVLLQGKAKPITLQVKRYCSIFFILFSLLYIGNKAKYVVPDKLTTLNNTSFLTNSIHVSRGSSMQGKKPHNEYAVIIFRNGIEGKTFLFSYTVDVYSSCLFDCTDISETTSIGIKQALSFSHLIPLSPEFSSSLSFRGPPIRG